MMNERIHRYLDGDLPFRELNADERRELQRYREALHGALGVLPRDPAPDVTLDVMARLDALEAGSPVSAPAAAHADPGPSRVARAWRSLWRRRPVHLSPGLALAAAASVVLLVTSSAPFRGSDRSVPVQDGGVAVAEAAADGRVTVTFRLEAPSAESVQLAGDFTGWQPTLRLRPVGEGVWEVAVPLVPGVHEYAFVVDGDTWTPDPRGEAVDDGFGGTNSRVAVLSRGGRT